jgi:hypothetical protein
VALTIKGNILRYNFETGVVGINIRVKKITSWLGDNAAGR